MHASNKPNLRIGILGCATIARKNARAIYLASGCELVAVASRSKDKALAFAADVSPTKSILAYGSYEQLLGDRNIDAVYMPIPTATHLEWVRKAASAGKHILIEKPVALSVADMEEIKSVCAQQNVVLMDGVMFQHHGRTQRLMQELSDPFTGQVHSISGSFCFHATADPAFLSNNIRVSASCDPLGALGDLGWYVVRLSLLAFNAKNLSLDSQTSLVVPLSVEGVCMKWADDAKIVPIDCYCTLIFPPHTPGGTVRVVKFDCSFISAFRQRFEIVCLSERGCCDKILSCDDFVLTDTPHCASFDVRSFPSCGPNADHSSRFIHQTDRVEVRDCVQEAAMFEAFATLCSQRNKEDEAALLNLVTATQRVCSGLMQSMHCGGAPIQL